LLKEYRAKETTRERRVELLKEAQELPREVGLVFHGLLDSEFAAVKQAYARGYQTVAQGVARTKESPAAKGEIAGHRQVMERLRKQGGGLSKDAIKKEGKPALDRLLYFHTITPTEVGKASEELAAKRAYILELIKLRESYREELLITKGEGFSQKDLEEAESTASKAAMQFDSADRAVMVENARMKDQILPEEYRGIAELNVMRIALGLKALRIDPKLCEAGRDHSTDMSEKGFFAHESPVPGKKTPWDRAKRAGTTASAENIYAGSENPHAANMGWFYSPGHHVNMFNSGHRRMGLGHANGRWTQLFGG
jgi:uncharacterized protein YkwD